jgi:hypothetical protein
MRKIGERWAVEARKECMEIVFYYNRDKQCTRLLKNLCGLCTESTVCILDLLSLLECALVRSQSSLGELVHFLICGGTGRSEHIKHAALIG